MGVSGSPSLSAMPGSVARTALPSSESRVMERALTVIAALDAASGLLSRTSPRSNLENHERASTPKNCFRRGERFMTTVMSCFRSCELFDAACFCLKLCVADAEQKLESVAWAKSKPSTARTSQRWRLDRRLDHPARAVAAQPSGTPHPVQSRAPPHDLHRLPAQVCCHRRSAATFDELRALRYTPHQQHGRTDKPHLA